MSMRSLRSTAAPALAASDSVPPTVSFPNAAIRTAAAMVAQPARKSKRHEAEAAAALSRTGQLPPARLETDLHCKPAGNTDFALPVHVVRPAPGAGSGAGRVEGAQGPLVLFHPASLHAGRSAGSG